MYIVYSDRIVDIRIANITKINDSVTYALWRGRCAFQTTLLLYNVPQQWCFFQAITYRHTCN